MIYYNGIISEEFEILRNNERRQWKYFQKLKKYGD